MSKILEGRVRHAELFQMPHPLLKLIPAGHLQSEVIIAGRMIEVGVENGDLWPELWGRLWSVDAFLQLGRLADAEAQLADLEPVGEGLRWPVARWHLLRSRAAILQARAVR